MGAVEWLSQFLFPRGKGAWTVSTTPKPIEVEDDLESKVALVVFTIVAHVGCAIHAKTRAQDGFKHLTRVFVAEAVIVGLQLVAGINPHYAPFFASNSMSCRLIVPTSFFALLILPGYYLGSSIRVSLGEDSFAHKIAAFFFSFVFLAFLGILLILLPFERYHPFCGSMNYHRQIWAISKLCQCGFFLFVILLSLGCLNLKKTPSAQLLLLFGICIQLLEIGKRGKTDDEVWFVPGSLVWFALPLLLPVMYLLMAEAHKWEAIIEEKKSVDTVVV